MYYASTRAFIYVNIHPFLPQSLVKVSKHCLYFMCKFVKFLLSLLQDLVTFHNRNCNAKFDHHFTLTLPWNQLCAKYKPQI